MFLNISGYSHIEFKIGRCGSDAGPPVLTLFTGALRYWLAALLANVPVPDDAATYRALFRALLHLCPTTLAL